MTSTLHRTLLGNQMNTLTRTFSVQHNPETLQAQKLKRKAISSSYSIFNKPWPVPFLKKKVLLANEKILGESSKLCLLLF